MITIDPNLALLLTFFMFFVLLIMYLYLVLRKYRGNRFGQKKKAWLRLHMPAIESYIINGQGAEKFAPQAEFHFQAIEDFFSDYLSSYKADTVNNPVKLFVEQYMVPRYRKRLTDPLWSVRVNTLYFIDLFKLKSMQDDLLILLGRKKCSAEERFQIYLLLAHFDYTNLQDLLKSSNDMPPFLLNELLNRLVNHDNLDSYVDLFHELPQNWQLGLLDVFRDQNLRSEKLHNLLESLLEGPNRELKVRALKTISVLGYITSPFVITRMIENSLSKGEWKDSMAAGERLMAAQLMGQIRVDGFIPYLETLITDRNYNVRTNAAKSIRKYRRGRELLLSIANTHEDAFAKNIAREWLDRSTEYE
ncbi:HEAT repeat domain-containing protein [Paenibacillus sp. sptzw28]|uniref:HEAT repeat domain-containing protein n=1 Tax=Paenibacillus sp. sptzw28 TaxID=715179 RepID=UPI001C6DDEA5|nr:HEAT repeat domain-containing protein [Paenibacillus sp. sptzw28]QYR21884.1 HEAT repeat domain-containing protein [Paenibacillus sp. sptzw28]